MRRRSGRILAIAVRLPAPISRFWKSAISAKRRPGSLPAASSNSGETTMAVVGRWDACGNRLGSTGVGDKGMMTWFLYRTRGDASKVISTEPIGGCMDRMQDKIGGRLTGPPAMYDTAMVKARRLASFGSASFRRSCSAQGFSAAVLPHFPMAYSSCCHLTTSSEACRPARAARCR